MTWSALWAEVQRTAAGLRGLGLRRGDRLAILARTRHEWQVVEQAAALVGATVVGIDPNAAAEQVGWVLQHAGVSGLVVDTHQQAARVPTPAANQLSWVVAFDADGENGAHGNVHAFGNIGAATLLPSVVEDVDEDDTAVLIYTSGTTGAPKGIEYSHKQLMTACRAMLEEFPDLRQPNRFVCWLPMAALFQRMINMVAIASKSSTYFVEDPRELIAHLRDIRPTVFFAVPRFYERLHDGIREQISKAAPLRRWVAKTALAVGHEHAGALREGTNPGWGLSLRHACADRLVLRSIRAVMGGHIKWMITGSAAAPVWMLEFFHDTGLRLLEAYGITENPVPVAANRPDAFRLGSVGKPFAMNDVRLSEEGEVLVKGPAMFRGYVGETAAECFTSDGYYRTGDLGRFDTDGFLFLTGRVAEIIKTSGGRRISPTAIEQIYRQSRYVDQLVVIGNNRPFLTALVTINSSAVRDVVTEAGIGATSADLSSFRGVTDLLASDFQALHTQVARHERIRAFRILPEALSVENGTLTATLKLRRDSIESRYAAVIDEMYTVSVGTDELRGGS